MLTGLAELGIITRGAGADNIRNITASPTAGIDPRELIDTRPLARRMHHHILNHRELYGLPRKFNIAFDGGGTISALADTNDIGFAAVRVAEEQGCEQAPPGVYFRMGLGGVTGHGAFARDAGWLLRPEQCVPVAAAVVRLFIRHGDRTDRHRARLKYLLDDWGIEKFMRHVREEIDFEPIEFPKERCEPRAPAEERAHIGFHAQRQPGLCYAGVVLPVGRITSQQMRDLAEIADRYGSGAIRLTCWQNLLISDIHEDHAEAVKRDLEATGLTWKAHGIRAALVACTGNGGCKFSASDTKGHALAVAEHVESKLELDRPINIHLTGCHHSCAQHYIGDIGLLGARVDSGKGDDDEGDEVEGYHVYIGGGHGERAGIGRELYRSIAADELPELIEHMLRVYLDHRRDGDERFRDFTRRHEIAALRHLFDRRPATVEARTPGISKTDPAPPVIHRAAPP